MSPQQASHDGDVCICRKCSGSMRLARVDPYPMPRGSIEIVILECSNCGTTLQKVEARTNSD